MLKNLANARLVTLPNAWWAPGRYKDIVHMDSVSLSVTSTVVLTWHANGAWGSGDDVQYVGSL